LFLKDKELPMRPALKIKLTRLGLLLVVVGAWCAIPVEAAAPNWIGPDGNANSGNWSTAGNWSPAGVPAAGDDVTIAPSNGNSVTVTYDYTGTAVMLNSLTMAANSSSGGNVTLSMAGNNLTAFNEFVGDGAPNDSHVTAATINQSGGTNMLPSGSNHGNLYLGHDTTDTGTYDLSGTGTLSVGFTEYIGYDGVGIFNQTGGSNTTAHLNIGFGHSGDPSTSSGSYSLSNGMLTVNGEEQIALNINGSFSQSGGTNSSTHLAIGNNQLGNTGMYTLSGGSVSTGTEDVGAQEGIGTLTQSGSSTNTITTALNVASDLGTENGTYNMNGGSVSAPAEYIGVNVATGINGTMLQGGGTGAINQTAGTNTVSGNVYIGASTDIGTSSGKYTVGGTGILTANSIEVGKAGTLNLSSGTINTPSLFLDSGSTFNWTTGTFNITTSIAWGFSAGLFGSGLTLGNNQTLGVTGDETLGNQINFTLTLGSGAANNVTGTLTVNSGSQLNLNGGTVTTNVLNLGNTPSRLNWSSGTLHLTSDVSLDPGSTPTPFGGSLDLSGNKTFAVTGNETVGGNSFFYIEADSGGAHTVSGTLTVNPEGELIAGGGSITAGTLNNIGMLTVGSGTITGNSVTLNSNGDVDFYLANATRGTGYGVLASTGSLSIDGELHVYLNGLTPAAGQRFDLLDWGTHSGKFNFISLPSLSSGLTWSTLQLYSTGVLEVVSSSYLPGDFNRDGHINDADILAMEQALTNLPAYESSKGLTAAQLIAIGDINGDGVITNADLQMLLNSLRAGGGSADPVPEPASMALLGLGVLAIALRRRPR
jgi:Dockerin type I domain/PEP-CTERM motif